MKTKAKETEIKLINKVLNKDRIELMVLQNLLYKEDYTRRVIPYLKDYFFDNPAEREVFSVIESFVSTYNNPPTRDAIRIELKRKKGIPEEVYKKAKILIKDLKRTKEDRRVEERWLIDQTEDFCKQKEIANALSKSIDILEDPKQKGSWGDINQILQDALAVSFDANVGHDYFLDAKERFLHYNTEENKVPFELDYFNQATNGGIPRGTLNIPIAAPGIGKTLTSCALAASYLAQGKNVLYITLEMSRFEIARRIDSNLFGVDMNVVPQLEKKEFGRYLRELKSKTCGSLIIKQYPTAGASVAHFNHLLDELRLKKKFKPDVVFVDYLNIMCSSRIKASAQGGSFSYVKSISEEVRGLAVERDVIVWAPIQPNREGIKSQDIDLTDIAESIGISYTADFLFAMMPTKALDRVLIKVLKNRYNDINVLTKFLIGVERKQMRLFDVNEDSDFDHEYEGYEDQEMSYSTNGNGKNSDNRNQKKRSTITKKSIGHTMKKYKTKQGEMVVI